jgi:UDP:flavonoid glycosyltransferase YjiC (YdhE family)
VTSKILFASMPFDGHFNPLTGLAVHLAQKGHDVRFYTGPKYAKKLGEIGIPHFPFERARDVNAENLVELFPEYPKLGNGPKAIEFAATKVFFGNLEAHFRDICALRSEFPFEAMVCDGALYAARFVAEKLGIPVYVVNPGPSLETSKDIPPPFFGLKPSRSIFGRVRDFAVRTMLESSMKNGKKILNDLRRREGLPPYEKSPFDLHVGVAKAIFQIGAPGFDYPRSDPPPGFEYVGALLPHRKSRAAEFPLEEKLKKYGSLIAISQGTVDNRDPEKLFVPALEALKNGPHLVVVTTGYRNTEALRARFPHDNVVVEDFIDFHVLLERTNLFICNGGSGSILLALSNGVPVLSAGKLEGKIDINARIDYAGVGVDLKTERPKSKQIADGVARVLSDPRYRENAKRLAAELLSYRPFEIIERRILGDLEAGRGAAREAHAS